MLPIFAPRNLSVWHADLDQYPVELVQPWLSQDELERALRFRRVVDRRRFQVGRGLLRWLLAQYLDDDPASLHFNYSPLGKPLHPHIHFNLAHSENLWVCGLSWQAPLGIDAEKIRPMRDNSALLMLLDPLETPQDDQGFLRQWTYREAYGKALGVGLLKGLHREEACWVSHFDLPEAVGTIVSTKAPETLWFAALQDLNEMVL
jgi:4'-phosphopantetheinyl transferase